MRQRLPNKPNVTHQTISSALDGSLITLKDIRSVPMQWNTVDVKNERQEFAEWLLGNGQHVHKVYMDEFGVNVWTSRTKGRAAQGQRAVRIIEGQRGQNLTIVLATSNVEGLVHYMCIDGGITGELFAGFLMEISALLDEPFVMLCDNARPHTNPPVMGHGQEVRFLPRYSPFLNATEMAGSCLKAAIKRRMAEPHVQRELYERDMPREETLHNRRMRILRREVETQHSGAYCG